MKEISRSFQFRRCIYNIDMRKRDFALDPARGRLTKPNKGCTAFTTDENKNQNHSLDKVQNLGNERRYICKDPRQDSGQRNI